MLEICDNERALRYAAHNGHLLIVRYLIERGANLHANNEWWALQYASHNGHLPVVQYLEKVIKRNSYVKNAC